MKKNILIILLCCSTIFCCSGNIPENIKKEDIIKKEQIKSEKVFKYFYKNGELDIQSKRPVRNTEFDSEGNEIKRTVYSPNDPFDIYWITEWKIENGKPIESITRKKNMSIVDKSEYVYKNDTVEILNYDRWGVLTGRYINVYDEKGRITLYLSFDKEGVINQREITTYDTIGVVENVLYGSDSIVAYQRIRQNDDPRKQIFRLKNEYSDSPQTKIFDEKGRIVSSSIQHKGDKYPYMNKFKYNEYGLLSEEIEYAGTSDKPIALTEYIYEK